MSHLILLNITVVQFKLLYNMQCLGVGDFDFAWGTVNRLLALKLLKNLYLYACFTINLKYSI